MSHSAIPLIESSKSHSVLRLGVPPKLLPRIAVMLGLITVVLLGCDWQQRRGAWAVVIAGGTVSSIHRSEIPRPPSSSLGSNGFNSAVSSLFENVRTTGIPTNDCVIGVNLSRADVGHELLPWMASLSALEFLALDARQIGPELGQLRHLSHLRQLKIVDLDEQTSVRHLLTLPHLEELRLVNPRGTLRDFADLGKLPSLRQLEIEAIDVTSADWALLLSECRNWPHIETIRIRSQFGLRLGLEALQSCVSLTSLELSAPMVDLDLVAIGDMRQLTRLVLNAKKLHGSELLRLRSLRNLRTLEVYAHGDHETALEKLRQSLPNCEIEGIP